MRDPAAKRRNEHVDSGLYDVVCVGAGGAGVSAAVTAAAKGAKVALLSKEPIGYGNTRIAWGIKTHPGIAEGDSEDLLYRDMLQGGDYINNSALARIVSDESRLSSLMLESYGFLFRRDEQGLLSEKLLTRAGGHSAPRTLWPSGYGGVPIGQALRSAASRASLDIMEEVLVTRLLVDRNRVRGLVLLSLKDGSLRAIGAKAVVLATGGAGWLYYPHTDCQRGCTGDGYSLALQAGAELVDMEQVQFIPFALTHPRSMMGLIVGEPSTAGPLGRLLDRNRKVVATGIDKMTRAQVAVLISREVERGLGADHGGLLLDLSPNFAGEQGRQDLERAQAAPIYELVKRAYGPRAFRCEEPWEVLPSAHFCMGGAVIDSGGRTSVDGLYAAGEAAGGVHGGNRLGSVALAEIFVFGRRSGGDAAAYAAGVESPLLRPDDADLEKEQIARWTANAPAPPIRLVRRLQRVMWEDVGLVRDQTKGADALRQIDRIEDEMSSIGFPARSGYCTDLHDALELSLMTRAARAIALSALRRQESRGAHARSDYPARDDKNWLANVFVRSDGGSLQTTVRGVNGDSHHSPGVTARKAWIR